ncbi:50S ribosomal protein L39e [Candidatus Micrarchaeota archaeon]|nr:50S ribosomal protein L39e [Candidatus Micrarchaeota archaeon]
MGARGLGKKKRLAKAARKIRRIPAFVMIRTNRRVTVNRRRRSWRTDKLRIPDSD